ncbi:hypothetical protein [Candidatus Sororendozoicomonas aggregata]
MTSGAKTVLMQRSMNRYIGLSCRFSSHRQFRAAASGLSMEYMEYTE